MRAGWSLLCAAGLFWMLAMTNVGAAAANSFAPGTSQDVESGFDNVEVLPHGLRGRLSVVSVGSQRTGNNLLSVFVSLKNLTGHWLSIEAQTLYQDGDGNPLEGGAAGWLTLTLKPHQALDYRSASLTEAARDFLVRIRAKIRRG